MNPKIENVLQAGLEATPYEKTKSKELGEGYDEVNDKWELIIKYARDIEYISKRYEAVEVRPLLNQYAIVICPEMYVKILAEDNNIELIEKPKRLYFDMLHTKREACILPLQSRQHFPSELYGEGVIVAIIDSGIDASNKDFCYEDGSSRIIDIWDQTTNIEYSKKDIDLRLSEKRHKELPGKDMSGHGTKVAAIIKWCVGHI